MSINVSHRLPDDGLKSWANLLVTQPPIDTMKLRLEPTYLCRCDSHPGESKFLGMLHCVGGVTLGAIYEAAKELLQNYRECKTHWEVDATVLFNKDGSVSRRNISDEERADSRIVDAEWKYQRVEFPGAV